MTTKVKIEIKEQHQPVIVETLRSDGTARYSTNRHCAPSGKWRRSTCIAGRRCVYAR